MVVQHNDLEAQQKYFAVYLKPLPKNGELDRSFIAIND
jgi:hypothetical protein